MPLGRLARPTPPSLGGISLSPLPLASGAGTGRRTPGKAARGGPSCRPCRRDLGENPGPRAGKPPEAPPDAVPSAISPPPPRGAPHSPPLFTLRKHSTVNRQTCWLAGPRGVDSLEGEISSQGLSRCPGRGCGLQEAGILRFRVPALPHQPLRVSLVVPNLTDLAKTEAGLGRARRRGAKRGGDRGAMASKPTGRSREYFDVVKAIGECKSKLEVRPRTQQQLGGLARGLTTT